MKSCARCKVTMYCDATCQKRHWKEVHKHVCRDSTELGKVSSDDKRPSLLYNVESAVHPGMNVPGGDRLAELRISYTRGTTNTNLSTKELKETKDEHGRSLYDKGMRSKPKGHNIHGDAEFVVKLQPPLDGYGPWLCYDELRSFESYVPEATGGMDRALRLLQEHGIHGVNPRTSEPTLKGFLFARWEADNMRIFLDRVAPVQKW